MVHIATSVTNTTSRNRKDIKTLAYGKEEKVKVILDYDKYQELLERVKWTDLKYNSIALDAYDKAK